MNIENFTLLEFLQKPPELIEGYVRALSYIKPTSTKREIFHMKLKHVEFIKENLYSENDTAIVEVIMKVQKITKKEVLSMRIIKLFGVLNSIKAQMTKIQRAEENSLTPSQPNLKWEMVEGSQRMAKFGLYNTLEALSGGDILKHKKIKNLYYSEVFAVLYLRKTASDLNAEMEKIKTK